MSQPRVSNEDLVAAYNASNKNYAATSRTTGLAKSTVQERLEKILGDDSRAAKAERLRALDDMLEERKIDPRDVIIKGARITKGDWDVTAKVKEVDKDGNKIQRIVTTNNKRGGTEIIFSPKFAEGPKWPVLQAGPTIIVKRAPRSAPLRKRGVKTAIIHADEQMGYWRDLHTDDLTAFHDERAIDILLQVIEDVQPDRVVGAGDLLDNPEWSAKFRKFPEFAGSTQRTVNRGTLYMAQLREAAGDKCKIDEIEGNHDARMPNYIIDNAMAAHGLTRGYDQRKPQFRDQPALSVPHLLHMEEFGIKYSAAFPGGDVWLNEAQSLVVAHEDAKIAREERATLFHGHLHTGKDEWRTVWHFGQQRRRAVISVPCLARIDEIVDSFERRMRSAIPAAQVRLNWQQGFSIVHYREDCGTADFAHIPVQIVDGAAWVGDKRYTARKRDINGYLA